MASSILVLVQRVATPLVLLATAVTAGERTKGVLAPGTPFETEWSAWTADAPGPTVVITGGMHGNEPAGAAAYAAARERRLPAQLYEGRSANAPLRACAIVSGGNPDPAQLAGLG